VGRPPPLGHGEGGRGADHNRGRGLGLEESGLKKRMMKKKRFNSPVLMVVAIEVIVGIISSMRIGLASSNSTCPSLMEGLILKHILHGN
jgi:hypothetical protein